MRNFVLPSLLALCLTALPAAAEVVPFSGKPGGRSLSLTIAPPPGPSPWREAVATLDDDARDLIRAPFQNPRKTALWLGAVGALVVLDKPLTDFYQDRIEPIFEDWRLPRLPWEDPFVENRIVREDVWMLSIMGGSVAYGTLAGDERALRAGLLSSKAVFWSWVTSQVVLKTMAGRIRPEPDLDNPSGEDYYTTDPHDFGNSKGVAFLPEAYATSMPSYHFTQYFAVAKVYSEVYDDSWVPYAVAGLLSATDIKHHHHWVSDMVAGTALGIGIGKIITDNAADWRAGRVSALPVVTQDGGGLQLGIEF